MISSRLNNKSFKANITVESIVFDPKPTACESCGSRDNLRSLTGFVVCTDCLEGGQ